MDAFEIARQVADEGFGGHFAGFFIKGDQVNRIHAQRGDDAEFLFQRIDQSRRALGGDNGAGMTIESDDDREGLVLRGIGNGLADDLLMAQMNAVKNPNAYADFT